MTVLPSPIPHPLDFCPWQLPGWVYEALDWVVGVEWPEGNERAVWDLADQWYSVAAALAGPRTDAITAAGEVRSGYGGVGAVAEAFDAAWRKVAEGDEAPLPVLLAVSSDLGRLVEECGCDIEGAKLEVWIELGILVVELLGMTVAVVLTAGAASPAAAAAITATRFVVQQIFKKLIAQLARKTLKKGMKEATERAAKQVSKDGLRGLGRNALRGGLLEAAEEGGVNLAIQGYQNSTGRRDGLDLRDLGTSAVGGFAGGAAAPLAGLGRHATSRGGQIGEHFVREMGGEVIAEQAASLATGGGFIGLEEAARAATSGATGSAVHQTDTALQARLDGRLSTLTGMPLDPSPAPTPTTGSPTLVADPVSHPLPQQRIPAELGTVDGTAHTVAPRTPGADSAPSPDLSRTTSHHSADASTGTGPQPNVASRTVSDVEAVNSVSQASATVTPQAGTIAADPPAPAPVTATLSGVAVDSVSAPPPVTSSGTFDASPTTTAAPPSTTSTVTTAAATTTVANAAPGPVASPPAVTSGSAPSVTANPAPSVTTVPSVTSPSTPVTTATTTAATVPPPSVAAMQSGSGAVGRTVPGTPDTSPNPDLSRLEALAPLEAAESDRPVSREVPEWYESWRRADKEAFERRRHRGYFEGQRAWFEEKRRRDEAERLSELAQAHETRSRRWAIKALEFERGERPEMAAWCQRISDRELRARHREFDRAEEVREGKLSPDVVVVESDDDFRRINDDVADLATGGVETGDRSALTGDDRPPPSDRTRPYGLRGGLRPPLALHQTDLERRMPLDAEGNVVRTADPRQGDWFSVVNDGGPEADSTRAINCLDCTLSLYETWVHGRPRVSAPRTFDGYLGGDVSRPINGETGGPGRVELVTGGTYQELVSPSADLPPADAQRAVHQGYADLHRHLLSGGHGSFASLITTWEGTGSHAWVAMNQNGTVLYLDPQMGVVSDRPPYLHQGVPDGGNVTGIDALVVGSDGQPMPLSGRKLGQFSDRWPEVTEHSVEESDASPDVTEPEAEESEPEPEDAQQGPEAEQAAPGPAEDELYVNRMHLLDGPGQLPAPADPASVNSQDSQEREPTPEQVRELRDQAHRERVTAGVPVSTVIASARDLDAVFAAGVTPAELAAELDHATIQRLVPHLDGRAVQELAQLVAEPRVQQMFQDAWRNAPYGEPLLAEAVLRQLTQRPDLVRMILGSPELLASLTARPLTLHHLASHQQAIDVLGSVLEEIEERGAEAVVAEGVPAPAPTPLTETQRQISASIQVFDEEVSQPGFDKGRRADAAYRRAYLDDLYRAAEVAQNELIEMALRLAGEGGQRIGTPGWRSGPKDRRRAEDKVDKYHGDVSQLNDLAAAKIEFRSVDQLYLTLDRLRQEPDVLIVSFFDRFRNPQKSGYRDIQMLLQASNGHIVEFRLHLAKLDEVAEWEHALYEVRRDLKSLAKQEKVQLNTVEQAIYDSLLRREQALFWDALQSTFTEGE